MINFGIDSSFVLVVCSKDTRSQWLVLKKRLWVLSFLHSPKSLCCSVFKILHIKYRKVMFNSLLDVYLNYLNIKSSSKGSKGNLTHESLTFVIPPSPPSPPRWPQVLVVRVTSNALCKQCHSKCWVWNSHQAKVLFTISCKTLAVRHLLLAGYSSMEQRNPSWLNWPKILICSHETLLLRYEPLFIFTREALGQF